MGENSSKCDILTAQQGDSYQIMKRSNALVFVIVIVFLSLSGTSDSFAAAGKPEHVTVCRENMKVIRGAVEMFLMDHELKNYAEIDINRLFADGYLKKVPECPKGGRYSVGTWKSGVVSPGGDMMGEGVIICDYVGGKDPQDFSESHACRDVDPEPRKPPVDPETRMRKLELDAKEIGNFCAQAELGFMYLNGTNGKKRDSSEAAKWLRKAACENGKEGHPEARFAFAEMLRMGLGGQLIDWKRAEKLYQKIPTHYEALISLADMYRTGGPELPADLDEAKKIYRNAADNEHPVAKERLREFFGSGNHVAQKPMQQDGRSEANNQNEAVKSDRTVISGDRFARDKHGVITDSKTSLQWLEGPDKPTTWTEANA